MTTTTSALHDLAVATDEALAEIYYAKAKHRALLAEAHKALSPHARFKPNVAREEETIARATEALARLDEKAAPSEAIYAEHRWNRFFLVPRGHIHRILGCSTCYVTTEFRWLPHLSGLTEVEAVAAHGAILCTVCFPTAPVEHTNYYTKKAEEKALGKCEGSGTWNYDRATARLGYYTGNAATCRVCEGRITVTSTGKLRAHKPE